METISLLHSNSGEEIKAFACIGGKGSSDIWFPKGWVKKPDSSMAPNANNNSKERIIEEDGGLDK